MCGFPVTIGVLMIFSHLQLPNLPNPHKIFKLHIICSNYNSNIRIKLGLCQNKNEQICEIVWNTLKGLYSIMHSLYFTFYWLSSYSSSWNLPLYHPVACTRSNLWIWLDSNQHSRPPFQLHYTYLLLSWRMISNVQTFTNYARSTSHLLHIFIFCALGGIRTPDIMITYRIMF